MSGVGDLQIFVGDATTTLAPTSTRFKIIEAFIHLALSILETKEGRKSLADVAVAILKENRAKRRSDVYQGSFDDMPYWINKFLKSMRADFPTVFLREGLPGEAQAERLAWEGGMGAYNAGPAGNMYLHSVLIDNMLYARQNTDIAGSSYNLFKFQAGVSVAHEIVHLLTGFVTGSTQLYTPPKVTLENWGNRLSGEAGRYWENLLLGGVIEFYSSDNDPLGVRQAGTPYLFGTSRPDAIGHRISMQYIAEMLNDDFSFPIRVSAQGEGIQRRQLQRVSQETTHFRSRRRQRNAPSASSPAPDHPSSSMLYRSPAPLPRSGGYERLYGRQSTEPSRAFEARPVAPSQVYNTQASRSYFPPPGGSSQQYDSYYGR